MTLLATETEVDAIVGRLGSAICSSPDHSGPCATPWLIEYTRVDDLDVNERSTWQASVDELLEQRRAEQP
jgi:hypothetical protein